MAIKLHSLNDVKLVGRLTRDPDLRFTTQGTPVCHFRLAVGRRYKDRTSGEWREEVAFVPCNVWREAAERCGQRLKKGSPVFVEGRLKSREWQNKEGQRRMDLEVEVSRIQFLETLEEGADVAASAEEAENNDHAIPVGTGSAPVSRKNVKEDEVPF
jgi:single-strand DNA-binding protein